MAYIFVEVEENPNSWYLPMQAFEIRGDVRTAPAIRVDAVSGGEGPHEIVGWSSDGEGTPCEVIYVEVSDSGAAVSLLIKGGDYGIRMRPQGSSGPWRLGDDAQRGDPYMLVAAEVEIIPLDTA